MKKNNYTKTHNLYKIVFLFIVFLGIGYAFLEAGLNINGDTTVEAPELNVYVQSTAVTEGSTSGTPTIIGNDKKEVDFTTALTNDGNSFFEETTTVINKGSKKAYLLGVDVKVYDSNSTEVTLSAPYEYTITNGDGTPISIGSELAVAGTTSYKFKFNYISGTDMTTVTDYPTYTFKITYNYTTNSFADDSWDTIATKVNANPSAYPVGATKTIEMDLDGDNTNETYTLRVVNNTIPSECLTTGFSQSACGFVVEFVDIIAEHRFNPYAYSDSNNNGTVNGSGNKGGWQYSDMRAYLNSTTYEHGNINYSSTGIYDKLPSDLKIKIIDTSVLSSYGENDGSNFTTTDKLYLLSTHEIAKEVDNTISGIDDYDTMYNLTRQLDYYEKKGVTTTNYTNLRKKLNNSNSQWWLRSAKNNWYGSFYRVDSAGYISDNTSNNTAGVSPAFRIGTNE